MYSVGVAHGRFYPSLCQRLVSLLLMFCCFESTSLVSQSFLIHLLIHLPPNYRRIWSVRMEFLNQSFPPLSQLPPPPLSYQHLRISPLARGLVCIHRNARARAQESKGTQAQKGGKAQRIFAQGLRVTLASFALTSSQSKLKNCFPSASSASNGPSTVPPPPSHTTSYSLAATVTWRSMS